MTVSERTHFTMEEVAQRTGFTPRTLRYYEEIGLLAPTDRTEGGHRLYRVRDVERLERIKSFKELLGYSLTEMQSALHLIDLVAWLRQTPADESDLVKRLAVVEETQSLMTEQLAVLESRLQRLQGMYEEGRDFERRLIEERDQLRALIDIKGA